jgi:hypothetical protein
VQFEHREVMHGAVQDFPHALSLEPDFVGAVFTTEDGFQSWHIEHGAGSIDETLIDLVKFTAAPEQEVTTVFKLIGAIGVPKLGELLFLAG